jgi:hypothetical protein
MKWLNSPWDGPLPKTNATLARTVMETASSLRQEVQNLLAHQTGLRSGGCPLFFCIAQRKDIEYEDGGHEDADPSA